MKKLIITKSPYGYEIKTSDDRFYVITNESGKYREMPLKIKRIDQMIGTEINYIPNHIKSIVFKLQKNENRD